MTKISCASWSGGKDSCFAAYLAMQQGMQIERLVHFDRPLNLHGVDPSLIRLQAELAGIPLVQKRVGNDDFEREFRETIGLFRQEGVRTMVFGDIFLDPHRIWIERVCGELDVDPVLPLWGMSTETIISDFIDRGFETIIVSGRQELIGKEWIGRRLDEGFIDHLRARNLDVCGENGEFHTFVTGGPLFKGRIAIRDQPIVERDGFWFFDVRKYDIVSL